MVLSHQSDLDTIYQPVIPVGGMEARSDQGDTLPVSPVKPIIRADLAPSRLLSISSTPSELEEWVEGIEAWMTGMYLNRSRWESRVVAEARYKLERDLSTHLGLRFNYTTGNWSEMVQALREIFLLHHPLLKRRFALFQHQNSGEDLVSFCTRVSRLSKLANLEAGLTNDEILVLAVVLGMRDDELRRKLF